MKKAQLVQERLGRARLGWCFPALAASSRDVVFEVLGKMSLHSRSLSMEIDRRDVALEFDQGW
ncbi:MAG: hypothetical protein MI920_17290 [Kiloniellales bacterium]|nr:hypothetical protein [Kiloniellales bacterium]